MVNYGNGKIYKIEHSNGEGDIYIGSTTKDYLSQRMDSHRAMYKRWKVSGKQYITSYSLFEQYGVDNCKIVLLEIVQAQSKDELRARESHWIRSLHCVNKNIPGRTITEYYNDNKQKQHREEIKDEIKQYNQHYYQNNMKKAKDFWVENRDEILEKRKTDKYECFCGSIVRMVGKVGHERSKKHLQFIKDSTHASIETQNE